MTRILDSRMVLSWTGCPENGTHVLESGKSCSCLKTMRVVRFVVINIYLGKRSPGFDFKKWNSCACPGPLRIRRIVGALCKCRKYSESIYKNYLQAKYQKFFCFKWLKLSSIVLSSDCTLLSTVQINFANIFFCSAHRFSIVNFV